MKIVVLDGQTANPGDLDWGAVAALGDLIVHPRTAVADTVRVAEGAEVLATNKAPISRETIEALPNLKFITVLATGYNIVDIAAARERGIVVSNVPAYSTASVAQLTFGLLLELTHHAGRHSDSVRKGEWASCPDFSYALTPLVELEGLQLGIVGLGNIGMRVAEIASAFGMHVVALASTRQGRPSAVERLEWEAFFATSDVISLHCPQTPETAGLIDAEVLRLMKPSSFLINTSRGGLIVEADLANALDAGQIAGAGLDVLSTEPPKLENPLLRAKNCLITPHIAWASLAARRRLLEVTAANIAAYQAGSPQNVVS